MMTSAAAVATVGGTCSPAVQSPVAPGDVIDLRGPDVPADQKALGITWDYMWTVKENDASGGTVTTFDTQAISFTVPTEKPAKSYYFELMVTAHQAQLCINQACMSFPIVAPGQCTITTSAPSQICISDAEKYTYSTAATPSQVNQRWWVFPLEKLPEKVDYNSYTEYKVGDGSSVAINWNSLAKESGTYVVYSGYYGKKSPYAFQGSCQVRPAVVAVPSSTITVT